MQILRLVSIIGLTSRMLGSDEEREGAAADEEGPSPADDPPVEVRAVLLLLLFFLVFSLLWAAAAASSASWSTLCEYATSKAAISPSKPARFSSGSQVFLLDG